ncbi:MAG: hypothetical protein LBJ63_10840 [Prevotellaceae bacterium]|jgi:hypothetical protein|nr:hypothetical protein [Prevotellaceae bacterium]
MQAVNYTVLNSLAVYLTESLQYELLQQGHVATDKLFDSINVHVERTISGFSVVGNALFYAKFVEKGRKPGLKGVPVDVLVDWIRQKKMNLAGKSERSVAFAIQVSIKQKGIEPSKFIEKTLQKGDGKINNSVERFCSQYIDSVIKEIFKSNKL